MSSFEMNKIFAAVLVAGIVAMLGGFIAKKVVHPHKLKKDAVTVEGEALASGGAAAKPKLPEPAMHLIAAADIARGEKLSKACMACHSFNKGGPVKQGPNMWNIVGANKAAKAGFAYSQALQDKGGKWGYHELNHFLWKPKSYVPGTKMNFVGLKKPEDRAALIAWVRTMADSPKALPNAADIAAEATKLAPPAE